MALNLCGVGFSFGAKDLGLSKMQAKISTGFTTMQNVVSGFVHNFKSVLPSFGEFGKTANSSVNKPLKQMQEEFKETGDSGAHASTLLVEGLGEIRTAIGKMNELLKVNRLAGFISALSLGALSGVVDKLDSIAGGMNNLTSPLEARALAASKASKAMAINLGLTGDELKAVSGQAFGMAESLNISADAATKALYGYKKATAELGAVGLKSAEDLAKFSEVTGVDSVELAKQLGRLRKQFNMTDKDINGLVGSFVDMGQKSGDVTGAIGQLPEIMDLLAKKNAAMGNSFKPEQLVNFAKQTAGLGTALAELTGDAGKARSDAAALAGQLVESQQQMAGLFAGTAQDIPDFIKNLAVLSTSGDAFDLAAQGPAGLVEGLSRMTAQAKKTGVNMDAFTADVTAYLTKMGVSGAENIVSLITKSDKNLMQMMKTTQSATADLGKMAKEGFTSGITLQEAFDKAKEAAIQHFRDGGKAGTQFLTDFTKSAAQFNKILDDTSKKGGPLGNFVDQLRDVQKLGVAGLLPKEMQGAGILLSEVVGQLKPLISLIGGAILFFPGFTAVFGPLIAVLGLFAINLFKAKLAGESWHDAMVTAFKNTKAILMKGVKWLKGMFDILAKELPPLAAAVWESIQETVRDIDWKGIGKQVLEGGKKLLGFLLMGWREGSKRLSTLMADIDFADLAKNLSEGLRGVIDLLPEDLDSIVKEIQKGFAERSSMVASAMLSMINEGLNQAGQTDLSSGVAKVVKSLLSAAATAFEELLPIIGKVLKRIPGYMEKMIPILLEIAKELPAKLGTVFEDLGPRIKVALKKFLPVFLQFVADFVKFMVKDLPPKIMAAMPAILEGIWNLLGSLRKLLMDVMLGIMEGVRDFLVEKFPELAQFLDPMIDAFKYVNQLVGEIWDDLGKIFRAGLDAVYGAVRSAWMWLFGDGDGGWIIATLKSVGAFIYDWGAGVVDDFGKMIDFITYPWKAWFKFATNSWKTFAKFFVSILTELATKVKSWVASVVKLFTDFTDGAMKVVTAFKTAATGAWNDIQEVWNNAKLKLEETWASVEKRANDAWDTVSKGATTAWNAVKDAWKGFSDFFFGVEKDNEGIFTKIQNSMTKVFTTIRDTFKGIWSNTEKTGIKDQFEELPNEFTKIWNSIKSGAEGIVEAVKKSIADMIAPMTDMLDKLPDSIKDTLGIKKVSFAVDAKKGFDLEGDVSRGMSKGSGHVVNASAKMADQLGNSLAGAGDSLFGHQRAFQLTAGFADVAKGFQTFSSMLASPTNDAHATTPTPEYKLGDLATLVDAVNHPDWFYETGGMAELMATQTQAIREELLATRLALASSSSAATAPARKGNKPPPEFLNTTQVPSLMPVTGGLRR